MLCVSVGLPLLPLQDSLQEGHVALGEDQLLKLVAGHAGALGPQDIPGRAEHALHVSVLASVSVSVTQRARSYFGSSQRRKPEPSWRSFFMLSLTFWSKFIYILVHSPRYAGVDPL